jgi:hypothetical protein
MRRRLFMIAAVSAIVVAIVVTGAWFVLVQQTRSAINQWADLQRANGNDISWQSLSFSGYPLRIDTHIDTPQVSFRHGDRQANWKPSFLTFKISSIAPNAIDFDSPGAHDLQITLDDEILATRIEAETLEGQALFPSDNYQQIEQLVGEFTGVTLTQPGQLEPVTVKQGSFDIMLGAATANDPQAVHPSEDSLALDLTTRDISVPPALIKGSALEALGSDVDAFSTAIQIKGVLDTRSADVEALTAWRDGGGTVEVASIELQWNTLRITANGTLALDGELQPVGSFAARIAGLEDFITAMEEGGVLSPSDASIARITLAVLTRASDDGGPARAEIPITLQDRIVRLGPVALIQLPPIVWE